MARTSLIRFYWLMQNARVAAFTVSELLRKNQQGGSKITPLLIQIRDIIRILRIFKNWTTCPLSVRQYFSKLRWYTPQKQVFLVLGKNYFPETRLKVKKVIRRAGLFPYSYITLAAKAKWSMNLMWHFVSNIFL